MSLTNEACISYCCVLCRKLFANVLIVFSSGTFNENGKSSEALRENSYHFQTKTTIIFTKNTERVDE